VNVNTSGQLSSTVSGCTATNTSRKSTGGPLSRRLLESGAASMSIVPFMGDARPLALTEKSVGHYIGQHTPADPLAASMTAGPVDPATKQPPNPASGTPFTSATGWWSLWSQTVQDNRNFGPVHGGACNILFADGRVKSIVDANGDGLVNNGIDSSSPKEVDDEEFYSDWTLRADLKGN
jgi:prepilin-type processing-associated H-X9-DG protein